MTNDTRTTIEMKDITAIEFQCNNCGSRVIRPITLENAVPPRCSRGCQPQWFLENGTDYMNLKALLNLMDYCAKLQSKDFSIRFELKKQEV